MDSPSAALIFAPSQTTIASRIAGSLAHAPPRIYSRICTSLDMLPATIADQPPLWGVIVVLAGCSHEMDLVLSAADWFEYYPLILSVPDQRSETIAKAHGLRPRFITGPHIDYASVRAVVRNISFRYATPKARCISAPTLIVMPGREQRFVLNWPQGPDTGGYPSTGGR